MSTEETTRKVGMRRIIRVSTLRDYSIVATVAVLLLILSISSDVFLTKVNLLNVLERSATIGIIAVGGTLVIIAGSFDLSVGAIFAISGVVAVLVANEVGVFAGYIAGVVIGILFGVANGILVTFGRINSFLATLGSSIIIRGVALLLTGGFLALSSDPAFTVLGRGSFLDVKYSSCVFIAFTVLSWFVLARTSFGRYIYAAGGNAEASRLSGISVKAVRTATFAISGLSAGLAGVIVASRVGSGRADSGADLPLAAIAAIAVGGTSIFGGEGAVWRTVLGTFLLVLIGNGFNLLNVAPTYQRIFQGAIILVAVAVDAWSRERQ